MKFYIIILFSILFFGCQSNETQKSSTREHCFRQEFPFPDHPEMKDVQELRFTENEEGLVSGEFNWLPAEKDQRKGSILGRKKSTIVKGRYAYIQEGVESVVALSITLKDNNAIISGGDEGQGLETIIPKIDCANW